MVLIGVCMSLILISLQTLMHPEACKDEGGFGFHDRELMETQRAAILELAKDVRSASGLTMAAST